MEFQYENSFEVKGKINQSKIAILPIGAVEAHGYTCRWAQIIYLLNVCHEK